jgi:hypothetical protein
MQAIKETTTRQVFPRTKRQLQAMTSHFYHTSITIVVPPCPGVNPKTKYSHPKNHDTEFLESAPPVSLDSRQAVALT